MAATQHDEKFMKYVHDYKRKPALLVSKLYLQLKTEHLFSTRFSQFLKHWINILAELDTMTEMRFEDLYEMATSLKIYSNSSEVNICWLLHTLRTSDRIENYIHQQFLDQSTDTDSRTLVCRCFCYAMLDAIIELYTCLLFCFDGEHIFRTRSILFSFPEEKVNYLKKKLIDGRLKNLLCCTCNSGVRNFAFSSSLKNLVRIYSVTDVQQQETSFILPLPRQKEQAVETQLFQVCKLHRLLSELDDISRLLARQAYDATSILTAHMKACRYDFAKCYTEKYEKSIDWDVVKELKMS